MDEQNNFLQLDIIWKDEHMLELQVTVSNNGFSGTTNAYASDEYLETLAKQLDGFPKN